MGMPVRPFLTNVHEPPETSVSDKVSRHFKCRDSDLRDKCC